MNNLTSSDVCPIHHRKDCCGREKQPTVKETRLWVRVDFKGRIANLRSEVKNLSVQIITGQKPLFPPEPQTLATAAVEAVKDFVDACKATGCDTTITAGGKSATIKGRKPSAGAN